MRCIARIRPGLPMPTLSTPVSLFTQSLERTFARPQRGSNASKIVAEFGQNIRQTRPFLRSHKDEAIALFLVRKHENKAFGRVSAVFLKFLQFHCSRSGDKKGQNVARRWRLHFYANSPGHSVSGVNTGFLCAGVARSGTRRIVGVRRPKWLTGVVVEPDHMLGFCKEQPALQQSARQMREDRQSGGEMAEGQQE